MKRVSLATLALLVGAAACQDAVTSPQLQPEVRFARSSNPPPPPIDTGATGSFTAATLRAPEQSPKNSPFFRPRFSVQQLASPLQQNPKLSIVGGPPRRPLDFVQSQFSFSIPVTYFFNPTSHAGYLHFSSDPANDVNASSNGMLKVKNGVLSGKGMLQIQTTGGLLVIDLSSIQQPPSFLGCGPTELSSASQNDGGVCFNLFFSHATLYPTGGGDPIEGTAEMDPGCPPDNEACFID